MRTKPVLILGGGLAGLSTAVHLKNKPWILLEREGEVGGTARSFKFGKFTFDFTGHLLHLHNPYTKKLVRKLLGKNFYSCRRNAWIFSHGTATRYPFQAATQGLPTQVVDECVLGFLDTLLKTTGKNVPEPNFRDWCFKTFGPGISRHFMIPYNEKLYQVPARTLTTRWMGSFVPMPKLEEVIRGALQGDDQQFGYNTTFLYPKEGGIQALPQALARDLKDIRLHTDVERIDWRRKKVFLSKGGVLAYSRLVNTIPLVELLNRMSPLPPEVERAKGRLRYASLLCLNLGVNRTRISDKSWIYFPEKDFLFYRVGFPMNFTPHVVPKGCSSMYVEVPMNRIKNMSKQQVLGKVRADLVKAGILKSRDRFPAIQFLPIKYAYVIFDKAREPSLGTIFSFLSRQGIQSIGRYGAWKYSFMEEAILDGKKAAEKILR